MANHLIAIESKILSTILNKYLFRLWVVHDFDPCGLVACDGLQQPAEAGHQTQSQQPLGRGLVDAMVRKGVLELLDDSVGRFGQNWYHTYRTSI